MALKIKNFYSPNFDIKKRQKKSIKFVILHYTGMESELKAIDKLTNPKSKVSCHYFIKNNGELIKMVPDKYVAWHAGKSKWKSYKSLNQNSIGIEIHNPGHEFKYKKFNRSQINTLLSLLRKLKFEFGIKVENIIGHSDIAPERKKDPGEKFPWIILSKNKLCLWPNINQTKIKKFRNILVNNIKKKKFINNLKKIGYTKIDNVNNSRSIYFLTLAFQRRFRGMLINGKIDLECYLISENLLRYVY